MDYILYSIPVAVFVILIVSFYYNTEPDKRDYLKMLLPSSIVTLIVFCIMKYNVKFDNEKMMFGNYFD
jgi:uncharacterized BrkB/YihY/UPF0761 family membrane protein